MKHDADPVIESTKNFLDHYLEEIKEQFRGTPPQKKWFDELMYEHRWRFGGVVTGLAYGWSLKVWLESAGLCPTNSMNMRPAFTPESSRHPRYDACATDKKLGFFDGYQCHLALIPSEDWLLRTHAEAPLLKGLIAYSILQCTCRFPVASSSHDPAPQPIFPSFQPERGGHSGDGKCHWERIIIGSAFPAVSAGRFFWCILSKLRWEWRSTRKYIVELKLWHHRRRAQFWDVLGPISFSVRATITQGLQIIFFHPYLCINSFSNSMFQIPCGLELKFQRSCLPQSRLEPQVLIFTLSSRYGFTSFGNPLLKSFEILGILGRKIVHALGKDPKPWETVHALSRSQKEQYPSNVKHDTIDLTGDAKSMAKQLEGVEAEYVFFAAYLKKNSE